ncbi:MAG TPA: hypothetical protein VFO67_04060 [Gemmatimonadales bacterium]|nr:hypothetical protein [Gemmatimonadales bacterium]
MLLVYACQDPADAPLPLTVSAEPDATTSGDIITLTSEQFTGLSLAPSPDTLRPNRWTNFAVIVGSDTAESWRVGPDQIVFQVPPVLTGNYDARIEAVGYDRAQISFFAVGLAFPMYWGGLSAYTNVASGTLFPGRGLLVADDGNGYGLVDVQDQRLRMYDELRETPTSRVKMFVPGPSYRGNHFIFDRSPVGTAAATVWRADPWTLIDSLPCGNSRAFYTAVEISATTCLSLGLGRLVRNGTDTLLSGLIVFREGEFRLAPGGKWAVLKTELAIRGLRPPEMSWPVFDQSGSIAYTIDTLFEVTGAAFSANGDTLFMTASVHDTAAQNYVEGKYSLVVLETATGRTLATRVFPSDRALQDVALDPVRPLLYVGAMRTERDPTGFIPFRQYLTVLDRRDLSVVADMPAPWGQYLVSIADATLIYQNGRVSVVGWCGFDCGGLWVYTYDLP